MLHAYFRQFGAIERIQIIPERLYANNLVRPIDFNQQFEQRNYFAYVTFVSMHGAEEALKTQCHTIRNHIISVRPAFSWNQAPNDVQKYLARFQPPDADEQRLFERMTMLNCDCVLHLLPMMGILEIIRLARQNDLFKSYALLHKTIRMQCGRTGRVSLMKLREFLKELEFGANILNLEISLKLFSTEVAPFVCDRLYCYIGPQLRSLTLSHFNLTNEQFERMKPLLINLEFFEADYHATFDFRAFNCNWERLSTLRIRTFGQLDRFIDDSDNLPNFPALTKLLLVCSFQINQNHFERMRRSCRHITELVAINVYDYYSEIARSPATDLNYLIEFQSLVKLHLSFTRRYYPNNFMDTLCQLKSLQHLTLDVTKSRQHDDQSFSEINRNLPNLANHLVDLKELQLCGITIETPNLLQLISSATNLNLLAMHECPELKLTCDTIRNIIDRRRDMARNNGMNLSPLTMSLDEPMYTGLSARVSNKRFETLFFCD